MVFTLPRTSENIRAAIDESNRISMENRNMYIIQEQATLKEIWEYVPCTCNSNCACRKFGCTHHWKLKEGLKFDDILPAFLRMFVDIGFHEKLTDCINLQNNLPSSLNIRVKGAYEILVWVKDNWNRLYPAAVSCNNSLLCDNWCSSFWEGRWQFPINNQTPVYKAKIMSLLMPDVAVANDTDSRIKLCETFNLNYNDPYYILLDRVRNYCINILENENLTLDEFRRLDSMEGRFKFDSNLINLKRQGSDYGSDFSPIDRPLSRVIDKIFYRPQGK